MHMVAARLGFEKTMVGTRWATPRPDCMDRLRKHYSHLAEGWFLARKAAWSLSGCMATNSADYYVLVNEWAWSKSRDCLFRLEVDMGRGVRHERNLVHRRQKSKLKSRNPEIQAEIQKSTVKSRNPL